MLSDSFYWTFGVIYVCLAVIIVILGSLQFVAILSSRKLRQSLYHVTIASLIVADVLIGLIICPTKSLLEFDPRPLGDYRVLQFVWCLFCYSQCVSCWGILLLHVYYLCTFLRVKPCFKLSARASKVLHVLGSLLPWILALTIVPGVTDEFLMFACRFTSAEEVNICYILVDDMPFFLPIGLVTILVVVNVLVFKCRGSGSSDSPLNLTASPSNPVKNPYALVVVSLVTVVLLVPFVFNKYIFMTLVIDSRESYEWYVVNTFFFSDVKAAVVPLLWMMDGTIRARMVKAACCRWQQDRDDINDVMMYERVELRHGGNDIDNVRPPCKERSQQSP